MNKFIIFKLKEVTPAGAFFSNDGTGIEIISMPMTSISHMTAKEAEVSIFFNDVNAYDQSSISGIESIQKSVVSLSCTKGQELSLIEKIASFSVSEKSNNAYILFDSTGDSSFTEFTGSIKARVRKHPVNRITESTSVQEVSETFITSNTLNNIDFGAAENKPTLDLDCRNATYGGAGSTMSDWTNSGTGGATYGFGSITNSVTALAGTEASGFNPNISFVRINTDSYVTLANELTVYKDYTMYFVYGNGTGENGNEAPIIYGVDAGDTSGGVGIRATVDEITSNIKNQIGISYQERYGDAASSGTLVDLGATSPGVLVIRRDNDFNISIYNANGDLVASIPSNVNTPIQGTINTYDGDTSGNLVLKHIGTAAENTDFSFNGRLARFGVIEKDVGANEAQRIAKDLFNLYSI